MPNQREVQAFLDSVPEKLLLNEMESMELSTLMQHPGFTHLLGLLVTARQGCYVQLGNMTLYNEAGRHHASVLQGMIKGIDLVHQTLLEQFPMAEAVEQQRTTR